MGTKTKAARAEKREQEETEINNNTQSEENGEQQTRLRRTMLYFKEIGLLMSAYELHTVEKTIEWNDNPYHPGFRHGIAINKGIQPGQFVNKVDIDIWYEKEKVRDEKWEKLMEILKTEGIQMIEV